MNVVARASLPLPALLPLLALPVFLAGCGGAASFPPTAAPEVARTGPATSVYVTQAPSGNGVLVNAADITTLQLPVSPAGATQPLSTFTLPQNALSEQIIAVNAFGHLFTAALAPKPPLLASVVYEFAPGATGSSTPLRTLVLPGAALPGSIAFDPAGNVYVASDSEIDVFAPGSTTPARTIAGQLTQLADINEVAANAAGEIFVSSGAFGSSSVLVFSAAVTGNVAPARTITGAGSQAFVDVSGIALDAAGNLFVSVYLTYTATPAEPSTIFEFAPGASGRATPLKTIAGTATKIQGISCLRIDPAGNLFALDITPVVNPPAATTYQPSVLVFSPAASGNSAPATIVTSSAWTSVGVGQMGIY